MSDEKYDVLKLEKQLSFPLYAGSKEMIKRYKPFLSKLDLTYTQYITMMVLWENGRMNVKDLGRSLYLDSGTLTPVLKKLEAKKYLTRKRSKTDERNLVVEITETGKKLREKALKVPEQVGADVRLSPQDEKKLYELLYKLLGNLEKE